MEDKKDSGNTEGEKSETLIENADILPGFYSCLYNAEKFLDTSKKLLESGDFQSSIPLSTISIEESLKGLELLTKFRHNEVITVDDWKELKNHKHKLTHVMGEVVKDLKKSTTEELEAAKKEIARTGQDVNGFNADFLIKNMENRSGIHSHFQELREGCFYTNWDKLRGKWVVFDELSSDMQEALAFYVFAEAQLNLSMLKIGIERYVNKLRETGQLLKKVPYPSYVELRTPDKWESNSLPPPIQSKVDQVKYDKGLKVMQQFIEQRSFQFLSFGVFRKTMLEYLKVIAKQDDDKWYPHPMIKSMMMALSLAKKEKKIGANMAALSDDSNLTYSGKPTMSFSVIAKMVSEEACEVVNITELSHPEFQFNQDIMEKIIRTETIIERHQDKEIPFSTYIEALNAIGIRTKMIRMDEIPAAIRYVKDLAQKGQLTHFPKETVEQILAIKGVEEWDDLESVVRATTVSLYGINKYPEFNSHMTPVDKIPKFKCRQTVLFTLEKPYLKTA